MAKDTQVDVPSFVKPPPLATQTQVKLEAPDPKAPPPNLFSGTSLKLAVYGKPGSDRNKPIPGHELYWFSDEDGGMALNAALASGWRFVEKEEIALSEATTSPGNNDVGNHVRRWVGRSANDAPVHNYLMKIPDWLYEQHMTGPNSTEQRVHAVQEEQLAMGTYKMAPGDGRYTSTAPPAGARSGLPAIKIGRYYKPPTPQT